MDEYSGTIIRDGLRFVGLKLYTPLPPTLNHSYSAYPAGGRCRIVQSKEAKQYKAGVAAYVRSLLNVEGVAPDTNAAYSVQVVTVIGRKTRDRDCDSGVKLVVDAVFSGLGVDDRKVRRIVLEKRVDRAMPSYLSILVTVMDDD